MRATRFGPSVALLVTSAVVLTVVGPVSAQAGPGMSPTEAKKVVNDYTEANARNNATLDVEGQDAIEDVPIQTIDDATYREYQGRAQRTLNENVKIDKIRVYVPRQSSYPLQFLTYERVMPDQGRPVRQVLLFVKANESAPWKVSMAALFVLDASLPKLRTDRDGLVKLVNAGSVASLKVSPDQLAARLAGLWGRSANRRTFEPGPLTTGAVPTFLRSLPPGVGQANVRFDFAAAENRTICFRTAEGGALCLFVVSIHETLEPPQGGHFVQPPSRETLTWLVAPGEYTQARFDQIAILAAVVPKHAVKKRVRVLGDYQGIVQASGQSAGGASPTPAIG